MEAAYAKVCTAYERNDPQRLDKLQAYLDEYPDTPHANRIYALMASAYYFEGRYDEALGMFNATDLNALANSERDDMGYRLAVCYLKTGNLTQAAIWFETVRATSRKYEADCAYHIAYIRYTQGRTDEALKDFLPLQDHPTYRSLVPYYIAEIYLQKKQYDKAENVAQSFRSAYPAGEHRPEIDRILGEVNYHYGKYPEAMTLLERYVAATEMPRRDARYMLGLSYYRNNVYSKAVDTLGEVVGVNDALSQNAYLHIGLSYLQLSDKARARMAFEQAAASDADRGVKEQAAYNYALCLHETSYSAFGESVAAFEKFLNEFPASRYADKVSSYLVDVYLNTRSYEAALASIGRIARPSSAILEAKQKILFQLGTQAFANAQFVPAIDYFTASIALGAYNLQTCADATYWRAEAYYRVQKRAEAKQDFTDYLRIAPAAARTTSTYALAYYNLGYLAFDAKEYALAGNQFSRAVSLLRGSDGGKLSGATLAALSDAYNRIGDCYLYNRNFEQAKLNYLQGNTDYSVYQQALIAGLQKDYDGKVALLGQLAVRYPTSPYLLNALYEKGRSYAQAGDAAQAIVTFTDLLERYPQSPLSRKAAAEIGLLYYQSGDTNRAIEAYKQVVTRYGGSDEARLALRDLKSIYVDANRVDEYAALASTMPGATRLDAGEQDTLTYLAAEKIYLKGDLTQAEPALSAYLQHYPNGAFSEEALVMHADICFGRKQYDRALADYQLLQSKTVGTDRGQLALTGILRCAVLLENDAETIRAATELLAPVEGDLAGGKVTPELITEARYRRAKAYLHENADTQALPDLRALAEDTRTQQGAEAKYLVAQLFYNEADYARAEKEALAFIDQSTPHAYWLARTFVLLSDVYVAQGKKLDARQYLLSLQQNYQADDDIAGMITVRLQKLQPEQPAE
jgi:TolA-binding protein